MGSSVDVVIPIYKAGNDFASMLEKLYKQSKRPEHIYLLQTIEKKDEKLFDIKKCSKELADIISVHPIKKADFDHGASQGIGAVIAAGLATDGYRVVLIARSKQNLEKVHDEIMRSNKHVQEPIVLPLDITDCTKADTEIKDIHQKYGAVDILVNAAAMFMDGSLSEPVDNFRKIMEINVIAQYGILKTVTEIMKVQKNGYIFNVASRAAKYGFADGGIYGSTKFALLGLAESLYRELAPLGIRVTTLCPGWVNTDMAKKAGTPFKDEEMIQPDDLLNTIRCLLNLSENVCIKDIVFEMKKSII